MSVINTPNIRKHDEFEMFLDTLHTRSRAHWTDIAEAIGVNKDTITEWKKTPRAQEARKNGIEYALKRMEETGSKDWRMWQAKLKMLGVNPINRNEILTNQISEPITVTPINTAQ